MATALSVLGLSRTAPLVFKAKTPADYPAQGLLVDEFDLWQPGYAGAVVNIYRAGTTQLMPCFADPFLTQLISNPITLIEREDSNGDTYGKFAGHVYVPFAYQLEIQGEHQTGVHRPPLVSLDGVDASFARVTTNDTPRARRLEDRFADEVRALDHGELDEASAATNTDTITAALSAAAAQGGGVVVLPAGSFPFLTLTMPDRVILAGAGINVTTIYSEVAGRIIEFTGSHSGLLGLTIDGVSLKNGSIGLFALNKDGISLDHVLVKRFDTGAQFQGGTDHAYSDFSIDNCQKGYRALGDLASSAGGGGGPFIGLSWKGGNITTHTEVGIELQLIDQECENIQLEQLNFRENIADAGALLISGARHISAWECLFTDNSYDLRIEDNLDSSLTIPHTVTGVQISGGKLTGKSAFDGACQNVVFEQVLLEGATLELNIPDSQILLRDCEEVDTAFDGETTKISRFRTIEHGSIKGVTKDATAIVIFQTRLLPNEVVMATVRATAEGRNNEDFAAIVKTHAARGGPAQLLYDGLTSTFTVGNEIVGQSSGARGVIIANTVSGTTGTLKLAAISGEFINNELLKESESTGSARANGTLRYQNAALVGNASTQHTQGSNAGAVPTGWDVGFQVSGEELQVFVQGAASKTIAWNIEISLVTL